MATEQYAMQMINWFFQTAGLVLDTAQTTSDVVSRSLMPLDNDPYIHQLNVMIRNNECNMQRLVQKNGESAEDYKKRIDEFKERVNEAGCFCHIQQSGNDFIIITKKEEANQINKILLSNSEHIDNQTMNAISGGDIKEYRTDDIHVAYMFQKRCEKNNVPVKIDAVSEINNPNTVYKIRFSESDRDIMQAIKRNVAIDVSDKAKNIRARFMDYEVNKNLSNINSVLNLSEPQHYLVGEKGNTIKINPNSIVVISDAGAETIYEGRQKSLQKVFNQRALYEVLKMGSTTLLTEEQYAQYMKAENKKDFLIDVEREKGKPVLTDAEKDILAKAERSRSLIENKLLQDHPEEISVDLNDYNNEESLNAFKSNEMINYEASHDATESGLSNATFLNDARALNDGLYSEPIEVKLTADEIAEEIWNDEVEIDESSIFPDYTKELNSEESSISAMHPDLKEKIQNWKDGFNTYNPTEEELAEEAKANGMEEI